MILDIRVAFYLDEGTGKDTAVCFKHAVQAAVENNIDVDVDIGEFDSTHCSVCSAEHGRPIYEAVKSPWALHKIGQLEANRLGRSI